VDENDNPDPVPVSNNDVSLLDRIIVLKKKLENETGSIIKRRIIAKNSIIRMLYIKDIYTTMLIVK
jgi:hypothetical protein